MELSIADIRELLAGTAAGPDPLDPLRGECLLIRTVTMTVTGRVVDCSASWIMLDSAAWVADTGRFADAIETGKLNEVEPMGDRVRVARGSIVDVAPWRHDLPTTQK